MTTKEKFTQEIKILNKLGNLVIKYDDLKRRGLMTWNEFKKQAHEINSKSVMYVEEYFDWFLESNKHNSLPYSSSGSFLTAITSPEYFYENELFEDLDDKEMSEIESKYLEF